MNLKNQVMYLHVGSKTNSDIRSAVNELIKNDESLRGQFGRFKTTTIEVEPSSNIRILKPKAKSHYTRLTITITDKAYDALYAKLGAVPLGD